MKLSPERTNLLNLAGLLDAIQVQSEQAMSLLKAQPNCDTVPTTFSIDTWTTVLNDPDPCDPECGTSACAVGYAMFYEPFNMLGFTVTRAGTPKYRTFTNWAAVAVFFGLTYDQAYTLFSSDLYMADHKLKHKHDVTPAMVAQRIRAFCNGAWLA